MQDYHVKHATYLWQHAKIYTFVDINAANILIKIGSKHIDQHIYILHVDIQKYLLLLLNI